MNDKKKEKPTIRPTRLQGGSTVISLTGFTNEKDGEFYDIKRINDDVIILKRIKLENM